MRLRAAANSPARPEPNNHIAGGIGTFGAVVAVGVGAVVMSIVAVGVGSDVPVGVGVGSIVGVGSGEGVGVGSGQAILSNCAGSPFSSNA